MSVSFFCFLFSVLKHFFFGLGCGVARLSVLYSCTCFGTFSQVLPVAEAPL